MLTPLNQQTCPNCAAKLAAPPPGAAELDCEFCGTRFAVTPTAAAPANVPAGANGAALVLAADFQSAKLPGWSLTEEISVRVAGGDLQARCIPDEAVTFVLDSEGTYDDIDAQVVLQWDMAANTAKAPAWAGFAVRNSEDGYYVAAISTDGLYSIYWYTDEDSGALVDDAEHPAIKTDGPNHLRLVAHGERLKFYVNGMLVSTTRDDGESPFTDGSVALVLISTEQPMAVRFRNLELREVV
jgi:hypothetical protein